MDELAAALKLDPLEFRLRNLKDARFRAVLEAAAERFGWARAKSGPGHGHGIAGGFEKGSYVATCAEVRVDPSGAVRVVRLVAAFECGAIVNPDQLRNQVEGSLTMGLGGALFEAVEFDRGRILNPSLSRYRVPRFSDTPPLDVVLLDRKDLPSAGAGETPIVGVAPAVAGARVAATGPRQRALPLAPRGHPKPGALRYELKPLANVIVNPSGSRTPKARPPHDSSFGSSTIVPPPALTRAASASMSWAVAQYIRKPWPFTRSRPFFQSSWPSQKMTLPATSSTPWSAPCSSQRSRGVKPSTSR
jgi:CO/xanthine dehydrogenase Mo-binding subunit